MPKPATRLDKCRRHLCVRAVGRNAHRRRYARWHGVSRTGIAALGGGFCRCDHAGDEENPAPDQSGASRARRDGVTNPDNFVDHRQAMIRFSRIVGALVSAWKLTGDEQYVQQALQHVSAWFIDPDTRMNPSLHYAQAIKGRVTGRGIGIIDTIHLIEVAKALGLLEEAGLLD